MKASRSLILEKVLLKSILPVVAGGIQEWASPVLLLGRISAVSYSHKETKQKKPKCLKCGAVYDNYLLFVLHLQLVHKKDFQVSKYQFSTDLMTIYLKEPSSYVQEKRQNHLEIMGPNEYFLCMSHEDRIRDILMTIFSKFIKKHQKQKRQYFHSIDIFREVSAKSEDQDSEDDVGHLQRELEKMRICDFSDVNDNDKQFFIKWNTTVHEARKEHVIIGHNELLQILLDFSIIAKKEGIKRINVIMHGWTLWSSGKITSDEVTQFIKAYDEA